MTAVTSVFTPWYRRAAARVGADAALLGSVEPTRILDHRSLPITHLVERARTDAATSDVSTILESAYAIIRDEVRPVYSVNESTPASRTLSRGFGSCSQRLAVLESVARMLGVPTRVRALLIDRSFWYPRFPRIRGLLPARIMLVWPEFEIADSWRSASELFGPIGCRGGASFSNRGGETLFEAAGRCAIDWDGRSNDSVYGLSRFVCADFGYFVDRDTAFSTLGQTLSVPVATLVDPVMRHIAA
jgi:hypothetical protein